MAIGSRSRRRPGRRMLYSAWIIAPTSITQKWPVRSPLFSSRSVASCIVLRWRALVEFGSTQSIGTVDAVANIGNDRSPKLAVAATSRTQGMRIGLTVASDGDAGCYGLRRLAAV
ncbi:hypothetical protein Y032_0252g215 [Ancylostoma ceylanicum]|uniref:Uncharacterized protein n=1 Tax=Ancylostoma ceylanicum TaxID=53326 RepID=A0A016SCK5_9BILA|nr:hypothetical protein Y032_0252g215 [Ancylostoma ceylanicum]